MAFACARAGTSRRERAGRFLPSTSTRRTSADLEEKLAKLEEMMAQHPAGCGAVPFAAATPAEMARAARMDEKQKEKKRLAAQLQAIEDKTEALQVCLVPCGVSLQA